MQQLPPEADEYRSANDVSLAELAQRSPALVVFLRHAGCPFCREALADLKAKRTAIEVAGVQIVLVHMMTDSDAATFFNRYDLADVERIADPDRVLYAAFGLRRGSTLDVMGPKVWWQGFKTTLLSAHLPGKPVGDVFQMPGSFLIHDGKIIQSSVGQTSGDRPDYEQLACSIGPDA
jgi:peroxiredoxin